MWRNPKEFFVWFSLSRSRFTVWHVDMVMVVRMLWTFLNWEFERLSDRIQDQQWGNLSERSRGGRNWCGGGSGAPWGSGSSGFGLCIRTADTEQHLPGTQFSFLVIPTFFLHLVTSGFCGENQHYFSYSMHTRLQGTIVLVSQISVFPSSWDWYVCKNVVLKVYVWNVCTGNSICVKWITCI